MWSKGRVMGKGNSLRMRACRWKDHIPWILGYTILVCLHYHCSPLPITAPHPLIYVASAFPADGVVMRIRSEIWAGRFEQYTEGSLGQSINLFSDRKNTGTKTIMLGHSYSLPLSLLNRQECYLHFLHRAHGAKIRPNGCQPMACWFRVDKAVSSEVA